MDTDKKDALEEEFKDRNFALTLATKLKSVTTEDLLDWAGEPTFKRGEAYVHLVKFCNLLKYPFDCFSPAARASIDEWMNEIKEKMVGYRPDIVDIINQKGHGWKLFKASLKSEWVN